MQIVPIKNIEEELVRQIASGDQRAFERLYKMYHKRLCQFAFLILRSFDIFLS